ncbi:CsgG/HfaB family protein [Thermomonas flagellata]|uniref:CsgG/HfaB family protein n=1 Tax=Thermomonas flagellata TaxID=2888524 RepID=UPI001F03C72F|nr:CsgG/HfaB family protein [Thermomonas flagellata]
MTKTAPLTLALAAALLASLPAQAQWSKKQNDPQGAAAGANAQGAAANLEHCSEPMGTIAVVEEQDGDWYRYLTSDLRLPSTVPVIRMLIQQSNCFVVVERGRAMRNMMQERALMDSGELRQGSDFGKGQMVAADYTLNPSINFSQSDAGGVGAVLGAFGGRLGAVGALAGGLKFKKAETLLTMIDNRSGVQIGVAQGNATKTDFNLGAAGWGGSGFGALGGYTNTPEGKALAAAFADAYNNLVRAMRDYRPQEVQGGLGKGGKLKVGR